MPPDPTIPPTHQAHPYATLALRPGWLVSGLGVGARTGLNAEVTAYSIVFWGHDALPAQDMIAWQQEKARITAEMSLAGIKSNIPFDECVEAMMKVGRMLPCQLRETAQGGLAATPTGQAMRRAVFGD